jgi:hypothetical protein
MRGGIGKVMGLDGKGCQFHKFRLWPGSRETVGSVELIGREIPNREEGKPALNAAGISVPALIANTAISATTMNAGYQELRLSGNGNDLTSVRNSN